jgi:hypothetical protein
MTTDTATVETLTAEVRVLMVGKRQVTLSVYRQLDKVPFADTEPFGRVQESKDRDAATVATVGRDATGNLVASIVRRPSWFSGDDAPDSFNHWLYHTRPNVDRGQWVEVRRDDDGHRLMWRVRPAPSDCPTDAKPEWRRGLGEDEFAVQKWLHAEYEYRSRAGHYCDLSALEVDWRADAQAEFTDLLTQQQKFDQAKALPLIVLAGLR